MRRTRHLILAAPGDDASTAIPARSLLSGVRADLSLEEVGVLVGLSTRRWSWRVDDVAISLSSRGFLVSDEPAEPFVGLRTRDAELSTLGWHPAAAAFLVGTRWDGQRVTARRRGLAPTASATARRSGVSVPPASRHARASSAG